MPKDTFLNLPDEKRHLIEDIAISEFAEHGFDNASINRIVAGASIAKGSFYQYFDDKKDLFIHLMRCVTEKKLEFMSPVLQNPAEYDFFTMMTALYHSGLAFAKENPKIALIGNNFMRNREHPVFKAVFANNRDLADELYGMLLNRAIAKGEVRADINQDFVIHILFSLNFLIFDYYFEKVQGKEFDINHLDDDVMETVQMTLDFIKNGIGNSVK